MMNKAKGFIYAKSAIVTFIIVSIIFASTVLFLGGKSKAKDFAWPIADGTFMQTHLIRDWDDQTWQKELQYLKEAGMQYLIISSTADRVEGGQLKTIYPTEIPEAVVYEGNRDVIDTALRNAEKMGFKVFLGLNFDSDWWKNYANDPDWLYARMEEGNKVADELYNRYHQKYPNAFYGWYWPWEVDNLNFKGQKEQKTLSRAININLWYLKAKDSSMPFMISPFMNFLYGDAEEYKEMWTNVFAQVNFEKGDIFAPQDSVGAGGLNVYTLDKWFGALRQAVDTKPGLLFWSNAETFEHRDFNSADLRRFTTQLKRVKPYVDNIVTFAYSHYYSPNITNSGFHRSYMYYVKNGTLEEEVLEAPANFEKDKLNNGNIHLSWDAPEDDYDVAGYLVYRDGRFLKRIQVERSQHSEDGYKAATSFIDKSKKRNIKSKYEVRTFDFSGNISKKAAGDI